ncbi:hypothetical protein BDW59DRAFT_158367 [Aspergillus cavernicola]|uniref:Nucleoside phosphorylase domain-containing protein n=1 Tax=Aspergillus cavernicola TaxID=176166 RepID=A0ABR4IUA2_9EURO
MNAPPAVLLQALANLQARHTRGHDDIATCLAVIESQAARFRRPIENSDILFSSTYDHIHSESNCRACDQSKTVTRRPRAGDDATIHYGTIASGNSVIKGARERESLSRIFGGILCFEMEAAGLMNNSGYMVIRGICDYADSHKNKEWQPYAAAAAAAFAKYLIVNTSPPSVAHGKTASVGAADRGFSGRLHVDHNFLALRERHIKSAEADLSRAIRDTSPLEPLVCQSIDDIYAVAEQIQLSQASSETLSGLNRIQTYLRRLHEYDGLVEGFSEIATEKPSAIWVAILIKSSSTFNVLSK